MMTITSTGSSGSSSDRKTQQRKADLTSAVKKKDMIMDIAFGEGLKNGLATAVVVSAAVVGGHHASSSFKRFLSISAKASLPLMTGIFVGSLSTELSMQSMFRDPEAWGIGTETYETKSGAIKEKIVNNFGMPVHHTVLNWIHDHPFRMVLGLGTPLAAFILKRNLELKHLSFSQRIMATRVFAQGGILSILASTMMIKGYVEKRGRYEGDGELK